MRSIMRFWECIGRLNVIFDCIEFNMDGCFWNIRRTSKQREI